MRALLILAVAVMPAVAQNSVVRLANTSNPASSDFQIGDRFEIVITGASNQPVSVRTTTQERTDWSPVIGTTDWSGRWSTTGQLEKDDFGDWSEIWTVGGKLAKPAVHVSVKAPCLKGFRGFASGPNVFVGCETSEGSQTFRTPSLTDSFRTPDGRVIPGRMRSNETAAQYHPEILQSFITGREQAAGAAGQFGDEAGSFILKTIGPNALSEDETRNVLAIIHVAFEIRDRIPQKARYPSETLLLLRKLSDSTSQDSLKQQIAESIAYVQAH